MSVAVAVDNVEVFYYVLWTNRVHQLPFHDADLHTEKKNQPKPMRARNRNENKKLFFFFACEFAEKKNEKDGIQFMKEKTLNFLLLHFSERISISTGISISSGRNELISFSLYIFSLYFFLHKRFFDCSKLVCFFIFSLIRKMVQNVLVNHIVHICNCTSDNFKLYASFVFFSFFFFDIVTANISGFLFNQATGYRPIP